MGKTLKEKLEQLSPERRQKIEEESKLLMAEEMARQQLRLALKLTQEQMSEVTVSQMENRTDLMLAILRKYITEMGGELRLVVDVIALFQFLLQNRRSLCLDFLDESF